MIETLERFILSNSPNQNELKLKNIFLQKKENENDKIYYHPSNTDSNEKKTKECLSKQTDNKHTARKTCIFQLFETKNESKKVQNKNDKIFFPRKQQQQQKMFFKL